jgi:sigma-B regulation protein RsbU (phosphoserine phosphatase)
MSALFRRKRSEPEPPPKPPPELPSLAHLSGDGSQTIYVTGDAQRDTDRIRMLVESMREISSTDDPDELLVRMVDRAVKTVGAERGLLFVADDEDVPQMRVSRAANQTDLPVDVSYSSQVVTSVFDDRKSICQKTDESTNFDPSQSMIDLAIRAVMCVPLKSGEDRLGVIYVDQRASTRMFSRADLRFFEAFADMLAVVWTNRRIMEERLAAARLRQDMELARTIQQNLVPERPLRVDGYSLCGRVIPATETGGDYFDFFRTRDRLVMAVGDVSGHGVGAALVMAAARAYVRSFCQGGSEPAAILSLVNRHLAQDIADDMFMSMFLCLLNPETGEFVYANAGHPAPILLRALDGGTESLKATGMALGVDEDVMVDQEGPLRIGPGDTVVGFSDGLTELRQGDGTLYGTQRVIDSIIAHKDRSAPDLLNFMFSDALAWGEMDPEHADDVTVSVLRADG